MKIILIGPPGSGKGTQSKKVSEKMNIPHISTGDLLRDEVKNNTELGVKVNSIIKSGELVSDDIIFKVLEKRLSEPDCRNGFILDGFPRNLKQANMLEKFRIDIVIYLDVPDNEVINRISSRYQCKNCGAIYGYDKKPRVAGVCDVCNGELYQRNDDKPETVKKRLEIFHKDTEPVLDFYEQKGILFKVNGVDSKSEIEKKIMALINSRKLLKMS